MKINLTPITINEVIEIWDRIDPKPQYQRTPVWKVDRKRLLIDSIMRGYDLPKFYMNKLSGNSFFDYEVCDGQQRLRTIAEFCQGNFSLGKESSQTLQGKKFEDLSIEEKDIFLKYELTFAVIVEADHTEIRDLFARLQRGMGLNQAELRRALSTSIGIFVESIVENHVFFNESRILDIRNKHQDYIDHVIAYFVNGFDKDFKGVHLKDVYESVSPEQATKFIRDLTAVLDEMEAMNSISPGIFRNKWGFVDTAILIFSYLQKGLKANPVLFVKDFLAFENLRKIHIKNPQSLIEDANATDEEKRLYSYISSFQKDGALRNNMKRRHHVFINQLGYLFE
ncbi:DUF262 domain-containing protein [Sphingobacterium sp.]|uniref:DUF262 domain-containing protein n=1 Tax=Sphingobacterium sp. TaxID=341027 RepID=UPI0031DDBEC8